MDTPNKKHLKESNQNGFNNLIEYYKENSYCSAFSFDVYTQNHEDYISEFNQKRSELDKLTLQYELEYYQWLKEVSEYVFKGFDYNNPPNDEVRELLNIEAEILDGKNPKKVYEKCFWIVDFLEQQKIEISRKQAKTAKSDEVVKKELYNHIFKDNAFEIWQSMFDSFQITESSRTDVKFMFEEMKKDGLIFNTVNQTTFLDWISKTHHITIQKTSNYSKTKERISIYSNAKQLYKS